PDLFLHLYGPHGDPHPFPTRRASDLVSVAVSARGGLPELIYREREATYRLPVGLGRPKISQLTFRGDTYQVAALGRFTHDEEERSEEHTSELQSRFELVCRLLLEKKK